jgi:predicted ester cyclase
LDISDTNRRLAEQFNDAFNRGDLDAAANCFAETCQNHGRQVGRAGVRKVLGEIKINFPDAKLTTLNSVAEGEWVVVRCTYSGTHRGTSQFPVDGGMLVGVQPTGRSFQVQHMHMFRVVHGKIADHFANRDDVGMMRQLGLLPPVSSPQSR